MLLLANGPVLHLGHVERVSIQHSRTNIKPTHRKHVRMMKQNQMCAAPSRLEPHKKNTRWFVLTNKDVNFQTVSVPDQRGGTGRPIRNVEAVGQMRLHIYIYRIYASYTRRCHQYADVPGMRCVLGVECLCVAVFTC